MRIAILSDIHDNVWNLETALREIKTVDAMIGCGDYCSPFVVAQLAAGFQGPISLVPGNNDGDLYRITRVAAGHDHLQFLGEFAEIEWGGKRFGVTHYPDIARPLIRSGAYDVVCFGHNHQQEIREEGPTLAINPGPLMGYNPLAKKDVPATYAVYDTDSGEAVSFEV